MTTYHFFLLAAATTTLIAAVVDARTGHIPNEVTLGALGLAPWAHAGAALAHTHSLRAAAASLGFSLLGAVLCALLPLAMYRSAGLGGGDVKLFATVGAIGGAFAGLHAETYAFVCGMVWALAVAARGGRLAVIFGNVFALVSSPVRARVSRVSRVSCVTESAAIGPPPSSSAAHPLGPTHPGFTRMPFGPAIFMGTVIASAVLWNAGSVK